MSPDIVSIASILKIGLALDRQEFQLDYDTIKIYMLNEPQHQLQCL